MTPENHSVPAWSGSEHEPPQPPSESHLGRQKTVARSEENTNNRSRLCGVSPYEMMFGLPVLTTQHENATYEVGEMRVKRYVNTIAKTLENLRLKGRILQTTPLDFKIDDVDPREWVLVKTWIEQSLTPQWEGPIQVLLTTEAAIRTKERGWIHASRIKGPVDEPKEWMITSEMGDTELTLKRGLGGNELGRPK
ncbi:hypothetical protein DUI87_26185 [Hirundo rustica rustica]|uniref:Uncharacterized protein n=1 Tax=Hirundo rustica rustica TaxID=333673 RepID=A0A3M0JF10_HIRRU|nr:hypothetical protein DUI87_26185 [Hirundo rustica rustica]